MNETVLLCGWCGAGPYPVRNGFAFCAPCGVGTAASGKPQGNPKSSRNLKPSKKNALPSPDPLVVLPLEFRVNGLAPVTQGSMRHIGGGRIIHDKGPELTTWRTAVAKAAKAAGAQPVHKDVPLRVDMTFWLPKPKTVTREKPTAKIDLDKLIRAVNDALGGSTQPVAFTDDGQIVHMEVFKHYADESNPVGVLVRISLA